MKVLLIGLFFLGCSSAFAIQCIDKTGQLDEKSFLKVSENIKNAFHYYSGLETSDCYMDDYQCIEFDAEKKICDVAVGATGTYIYTEDDEEFFYRLKDEFACEYRTIVYSTYTDEELSYLFLMGGCSKASYNKN